MMPSTGITPSLQTAVLEYFAGERVEMLLILSGSAVVAALAVWLWMANRTGFAMAFGVTILASAVLLSATAGSLLIRDKGVSSAVTQGLGTDEHAFTLGAERERVSVVVSKYKYYRYGAGVLAALAVAGLMLSSRGWLHGMAAGLLILVVVQVLIDHFSEQRASIYLQRLTAAAAPQDH